MDPLTKLFIEYLRRTGRGTDAVHDWLEELEECDESTKGVKAAAFKYVGTLSQELLKFAGTIDLEHVAQIFQEEG